MKRNGNLNITSKINVSYSNALMHRQVYFMRTLKTFLDLGKKK